VFLAHDPELDRLVAIKVPVAARFRSAEDLERYLAEARVAARLRHPGIVAVYDVQRDESGLYIVHEYIEGQSLRGVLQSRRLTPERAVELMVGIADAVAYAHEQGLIHRDLKPDNVLVDGEGRPHVADFGLAIHESGGRLPEGKVEGTPAYMAPELIRGETHRLDGRTDLWSLGVLFYEMLAGRRPFSAPTRAELFDAILRGEAKPLRQIDRTIPRELERICLKCLAKRMTDRYASTADLIEELRHWKDRPAAGLPASEDSQREKRTAQVVFKSLRAFDENDADFFLELLPGPRDRDGLPESIRFWKTRIDSADPEKAFAVGLLYGPSGCGKSSLVRAGLIPRLAAQVRAVYLEATAAETESRLLAGLRRICPGVPADASLPETLMAIREERLVPGEGKIAIFLDQFEQWLHASRAEPNAALVEALRHCDGGTIQCVVMVRHDFGMSAMRFMNALEVPVVEGGNYATCDRFDPAHAAKVLAHFGQAFGRLPQDAPCSAEQARFLEKAVEGLAEDGSVVPVRLALFAEMFRTKPWDPAALKKVGGAEGIGVAFLDEMLGSAATHPSHQFHQKAARKVLKALLPERGTDLRGHLLSYPELLEVSGYADRPRDFEDLMRILDSELRLITPSEPRSEGGDAEPPDSAGLPGVAERKYQLTHDYLVPSLRTWLTRKQRETMRGRAALLLESRAELWNANPEKRYLPSCGEWIRLRLLTRESEWNEPQRKMMRRATSFYARRLSLAIVLGIAALLAGWAVTGRVREEQRASEVRSLLSQLWVAEWARLPEIVEELAPHQARWWTEVAQTAETPSEQSEQRLRAQLAMIRHDGAGAPYLTERLLGASPQQLRVIRGELAPWQEEVSPALWERLRDANVPADQKLRAASALAAYDPQNERWNEVADAVAAALAGERNPLFTQAWIAELRPVGDALLNPLERFIQDATLPQEDRVAATSILAELGERHLDRLAALALILDADQRQYAALFRVLASYSQQTCELMGRELATPGADNSTEARELDARKKATAAITLARLGSFEPLWRLLRASADQRVRTLLIHRMHSYGIEARDLVKGLSAQADPSIRQAILLALGQYRSDSLLKSDRDQILKQGLWLFQSDPDASVHAGAEWLLTNWGYRGQWKALQAKLVERPEKGWLAEHPRKSWYVNGKMQTMVVIRGPNTFSMGSSQESEPERDSNEPLHARRIDRTLAISAHEVTTAQFLEFDRSFPYAPLVTKDPECPINQVSWFNAVAYCRWLTTQEKIGEDQQCYPEQIGPQMQLPEDFLSRTGYRLPTEAEWELACRAGTTTARFFGETDEMLPGYAWCWKNCEDSLWPVGTLKPNPWGLFDVYGNVLEWCQSPASPPGSAPEDQIVFDNRVPNKPGIDGILRGGAYSRPPRQLRSATRIPDGLGAHNSYHGFRVVRTMPD